MMLAAPLAVVVHELGHVATGLAVGFRPVFAMVGPLRWRKMPAGWKFDYGQPGFLGGAAASVPESGERLRARLLWYISGGVLGNLITGGAGLLFDSLFATAYTVISVVFAAIALWPKTAAGVHTDGFRIRQLLRGGVSAGRWETSILLTALDFRGVRPRDWPADAVLRAVAYEDDSPDDAGAALLAYHWALDRGDLDSAASYLTRAIDRTHHIPVMALGVFHIEAAFLAALQRRNAEEAHAELACVSKGGLFRKAALYRAWAMTALAAGNPDEARHLAAEGLTAASDDWDPGMLEFDLDWLHRIASGWRLPPPNSGQPVESRLSEPGYKTHTMHQPES
jgi:hypothetical protein